MPIPPDQATTAAAGTLQREYDDGFTREWEVVSMPLSEADRLRILLVEADLGVAQMYKLKLELDEYEVVVAADGETALTMAADTGFDLIFLDIRLPGVDGLAVLERLHADEPTRLTPVVIISKHNQSELNEQGLKLGAIDYLIRDQTTALAVANQGPPWGG